MIFLLDTPFYGSFKLDEAKVVYTIIAILLIIQTLLVFIQTIA